jgi:hypothetical protein
LYGREARAGRLENGVLLKAAEAAGFEVFFTADKNLRYQQNLTGRKIALVVLGQSPWPLVRLHIPEIVEAINGRRIAKHPSILPNVRTDASAGDCSSGGFGLILCHRFGSMRFEVSVQRGALRFNGADAIAEGRCFKRKRGGGEKVMIDSLCKVILGRRPEGRIEQRRRGNPAAANQRAQRSRGELGQEKKPYQEDCPIDGRAQQARTR